MSLKPKFIIGIISLAVILCFGNSRASHLGAHYPEIKILYVPAEYPTIQGAIDAAQAGEEVSVSPGTYYETIVLKAWVVVRSEGSEEEHLNHQAARRTTIDANGALKPVVEGADGAVIDGFTLTGLGKVNHHLPDHPHGVECRGSSPIIINNIVHHMGSTGIGTHVLDGKEAAPYIGNNIIHHNEGLGIGNNHESAATVVGNIVYANSEVGIGIRNGAHPLIEYNIVYNNGWAGIGARDGSFPIIRGNKVYNNGVSKSASLGAGIGIANTFVPIVEDNEVFSNYLGGIGLRKGATAVIRNNETYRNRYAGIGLDGAVSVLIESNKIHHNKRGGIGITNNSSAVIRKNEIYGNENAGIAPSGNQQIITEANIIYENGEPYSAAPPDMTTTNRGGRIFTRDEAGGMNEPLGLPDPSFYEWTRQK